MLLGSGVSRDAEIPTGWEIMCDLAEQIASQKRATPDDPAAWYKEQFEQPMTWSNLLARVGNTAADRSGYLRAKFEPSKKEREEGKKLPTNAHTAIARLCRDGYFRVILTTNFDNLLEQAMSREGVHPNVVSKTSDVPTMRPLHTATCTIVKVHGDYRDLNTLNVEHELASYDPEMEDLLRRVVSEYGLIVCGWSGEWDKALRTILTESKSDYSTYWLAKGEVANEGQRVLDARDGVCVDIESADDFFRTFEDSLRAIERLNINDSLTVQVAAERAKRYLASESGVIDLESMVMEETRRLCKAVRDECESIDLQHRKFCEIAESIKRVASKSQVLTAIFAAGAYWGDERHTRCWKRCLERIARCALELSDGHRNTTKAQVSWVPATLLMYVGGIVALAGDRPIMLRVLLNDSVWDTGYERRRFLPDQAHLGWIQEGKLALVPAPPDREWTYPAGEWARGELRELVGEFAHDDGHFETLFAKFECIACAAWNYMEARKPSGISLESPYWPMYDFLSGDAKSPGPQYFRLKETREWLQREEFKQPLIEAGMFGGDLGDTTDVTAAIENVMKAYSYAVG